MTTAEVITPAPDQQLIAIVRGKGLDEHKMKPMLEALFPLVSKAGELARDTAAITLDGAMQTGMSDAAGTARKAFVKIRTAAERVRVEYKADILKMGGTVDACCNWVKAKCDEEETRLREIEEYEERRAAESRAALKLTRENLLRPFVADVAVFPLGELTDAAWDQLLEGSKLAFEKYKADLLAKEEARKAQEAADKAERDRLAAENARLQAERAEADRIAALERELADAERREAEEAARAEREAAELAARKERAVAEAKIRAEREAREAAERSLAEQRAAKEKAEREAAEAQARAEQAPDAEKLDALAAALLAVPMPTCTSRNARLAVGLIEADIQKLAEKCRSHAARLRS